MLSRLTTLIGLGLLTGGKVLLAQPALPVLQPRPITVVVAGTSSQSPVQSVSPGAAILLDAGAQTYAQSFQWSLNGVPIPGKTNQTLSISNTSLPCGGSYGVAAYSSSGAIQVKPVALEIAWPDIPFADNFGSSGTIAGNQGSGRANYTGDTRESGEPEHAGVQSVQSLWITWIAPSNGVAVIDTVGSTFDTVLAVYTGNFLASLAEVCSDDDSGGFRCSRVMFDAQAGVAYRIAIGAYTDATQGNAVLNWQLYPVAHHLPIVSLQPMSQTLSPGQSTSLSVIFQSDIPVEIQWYHDGVAIPSANQASLWLDSVSVSDIGVYAAALTSSEWTYFLKTAEIQLNTEGASGAAARQKTKAAITCPLGDSGFALESSLGCSSSAVQEMAISFPSMSGYAGTQLFKTYAGKDPAEPNINGIVGGASYWYNYIAPDNGQLFLNTDGSSFDTLLGVYVNDGTAGGYSSLVQIAGDDNSGMNGRTSSLRMPVKKGSTYYIMVDGKNGASGSVVLQYFLDKVPFITGIANQTIYGNQSTAPIAFTIGDNETDANNLQLVGFSSNQTLVTNTAICFAGQGANRTVTVTPTPNVYGTNTITISVIDAVGNVQSNCFKLQVQIPAGMTNPPPLQVSTALLPAAFVNVPFSFKLQAAGGLPIYSWSLSSGTLPSGLSLGGDGTISGTPSNPTLGAFSIQLRDDRGVAVEKTLALAVQVPPVLTFTLQPVANQLQLILHGQENGIYVLECSDQPFPSPNWIPIATNQVVNSIATFVETNVTGSARFYRARQQ